MAEETKKVTLQSEDGRLFEIDQDIAKQFGIIEAFIGEEGSGEFFPVPNVSSFALDKVIEYYRKYKEFRTRAGQMDSNHLADAKAFNSGFIGGLNNGELREMILAVDYLDCNELFDLIAQAIADRIKNKSVEYVRKFLGITNNYSPEEEEALRENNAWAFEGVDDDD